MPRPPRICSCGRTVPHGVLCQCQLATRRARHQRHDRRRPSAASRGYGHAWRQARDQFLKINDRCAWPGCGVLATLVDHVIPHRGDMRLFWDRTNWQPLCTSCHSRKKQRMEREQ